MFRTTGGTNRGPEKKFHSLKMVKARRFMWLKPVTHIGEKKNEDGVLVGKPVRKKYSEDYV